MKAISCILAISMLVSMIAIPIGSTSDDPISEISTSVSSIPDYTEGYGFDVDSMTMTDHNGFEYSYQPDGIIKLVLPWGYTTYFSFGLTGTYLGTPAIRTALDYTWTWDVDCTEINHTAYTETYIQPVYDAETNTTTEGYYLNESSIVVDGYDYVFLAENSDGVLDWSIQLEFFHEPGKLMKVTHQVTNNYPNAITDIEFWYLFDLSRTPAPYQIETSLGIVYGPLYQPIPNSIHWVRLSNEFQFDWRDALDTYDNGFAYIGDGTIIGLDGLPILGISLDIGDLSSGASFEVDPYFSGVTKTWNAGANGYAGDPANWDPVGHPLVGDNVTFDGTSVYNCNWNLSVTLGDFSMLTGYTGTVTQSVDFGCVDWLLQDGRFEGAVGKWLSTSGNFTQTGGIQSVVYLNMTTSGTTIQTGIITTYSIRSLILPVGGNITLNSGVRIAGGNPLVIGGSSTININTRSLQLTPISSSAEFLFGTGTITSSTGYLWLNPTNSNPSSTITTEGWDVQSDLMISTANAAGSHSMSGVLECSGELWIRNYAAVTLTTNDFDIDAGELKIDAGCTLNTGDSTIAVSGLATLKGIVNQGSGTITVGGDYIQDGVSSIFNQNGTVTIGTDFTVSAGVFNAVGDMTVPGSWNTATGSYLNDDNEVTMTGTGTLAMKSTDSFYNITIDTTAVITMNTNTRVDLRATILGTLLGTGIFIQPPPGFTSYPDTTLYVGSVWEYSPEQLYWGTLGYDSIPGWMIFDGTTFHGMPNATGFYTVSFTITWYDMVTYQNITLLVEPSEPFMDADFIICFIILMVLMIMSILGLAVDRLRVLGLFVLFGVAIMAIPIILAFGTYYWVALIFLIACATMSAMNARSNARGK